jgi:2'-phosphotransferase
MSSVVCTFLLLSVLQLILLFLFQGMRISSQIFIFINVQKALDAGIKFFLSDNGVVLTEGDAEGFLRPEFFEKAEDAKGVVVMAQVDN